VGTTKGQMQTLPASRKRPRAQRTSCGCEAYACDKGTCRHLAKATDSLAADAPRRLALVLSLVLDVAEQKIGDEALLVHKSLWCCMPGMRHCLRFRQAMIVLIPLVAQTYSLCARCAHRVPSCRQSKAPCISTASSPESSDARA